MQCLYIKIDLVVFNVHCTNIVSYSLHVEDLKKIENAKGNMMMAGMQVAQILHAYFIDKFFKENFLYVFNYMNQYVDIDAID